MKKVLIIGAKGNLGTALAEVYKDAGPVLMDREDVDIASEQDCQRVIAEVKPEVVFNCAAYNAVDKAEEEVGDADNINGYAVGYLARACNDIGATLVHFSSNYVFDGKNPEGYNEDDKPTPINAYGRSKRLGEIELEQSGENFYLVRTAWLFGGKSAQGKKSFIDIMIGLAKDEKPISCVDDEFGQPTYVVDLAQAVSALVEQEKEFGIYHITNTGEASWYDWAKEIFSIEDLDPKLISIHADSLTRKAKRPQYGVLNNTKYLELRPWTEALKEFLSGN